MKEIKYPVRVAGMEHGLSVALPAVSLRISGQLFPDEAAAQRKISVAFGKRGRDRVEVGAIIQAGLFDERSYSRDPRRIWNRRSDPERPLRCNPSTSMKTCVARACGRLWISC